MTGTVDLSTEQVRALADLTRHWGNVSRLVIHPRTDTRAWKYDVQVEVRGAGPDGLVGHRIVTRDGAVLTVHEYEAARS